MTDPVKINRRGFLGTSVQIVGAVALGGTAVAVATRSGKAEDLIWQIDPDKCISCGKCATTCVLNQSASKALNCFDMCGYCDICTGYFTEPYFDLDTGAENHMCPSNALKRTFVEQKTGQRFYEYTIDIHLCVGCAKCVKGCELMNGSLYMQVDQHECVGCNECSIGLQCPARAFYRIPASQKEILKEKAVSLLESRGEKLIAQGKELGEQSAPGREKILAGEKLLARCKIQRQWRREQALAEKDNKKNAPPSQIEPGAAPWTQGADA